MNTPRLEVLIACYGQAGIDRVAANEHPRVDGVAYTVCWQMPEGGGFIPTALSERSDFKIVKSATRGLSVNRNLGLQLMRGDVVLISDDDLSYNADSLAGVIHAFEKHPECDVLTFRYESDFAVHHHPDHEFDWYAAPKGCYLTSFELAFRRESVQGNITFNPHFGVNGDFCAGEEDLFFGEMKRRGLRMRYIPLTICFHPGPTTSDRVDERLLIEAKGAVFLANHRATWPLRMIAHARRDGRWIWYCRHWLKGVAKARRLRVFKGR